MHLPDGFLDAKTALAAGALAVGGVAWAVRGVRRTMPASRMPLLGTAAAFVFAAQMLNFPVAGGTSGHLVGATLAAVLLGPFASVIVIACVLALQCFLFQDGGLTALGANVLNMGLVATGVGYGVYAAVRRFLGASLRTRLLATAFAAWCSTVAASIVCAGELATSGTIPWATAFPAMAGVHALIGLGEAAITALVVASVARLRPELLDDGAGGGTRGGAGALAGQGLVVALGLALFVAPFACGWPDGLERVATTLGFEGAARAPRLEAPWPDYAIGGIGSKALSTVVAGALGTLLAFGFAWTLARRLAPAAPPRSRT
jgi:cobalt/nickel transport system permease protein